MSASKLLTISLSLALLCVFSVSRAIADEWNQATKLTFSAPVELPGVSLSAGTYWFTLMNDDADRNIVQVWGADRMHLLATILAIPDYRLQPTGKTVIKFSERPAGTPEAIRAWFYPGDNYGREFVYPKSKATELAKQTGQPVLSMPNETAENITKPAKSAKEPSVVAMKQAPLKAINPGGDEIEMAEVIQPSPMGTAHAKHLPKTASLLPFWGLLGVVSLGAGIVLRQIVSRIA